jgi:hypothetical protein
MAELEFHKEGTENDPMGKTVGVMAAVLGVLLAIVTIASHRTHTAAIIHKAQANDDWAYYQANSIKLHNIELGEGMLSVLDAKGDAADKLRAKYDDQRRKYTEQKDAQQEKAKKSDETADADEHRALHYDFGEGLLEISLVLTSLYFISKRKMFPAMGLVAAIVGTGVAISGLFV